jgi:hypothetical protein
MRIFYAVLAGVFVLTGCAATPAPGSPEQRIQEVAEERAAQAEIISKSVTEVPEWYDNPPTSGAALYSVGEATQRNLTLARRASLNQAKAALAERFASYIEGFDEQYMDSAGEEFKTGAKSAFSQKLVGFGVAKRKTVEINGMVQVYVLLEYPIGDANRLIVGEIKKSQNDLLQARKNEGFRMMEEMLESRGAN